jgi:MFS family permease
VAVPYQVYQLTHSSLYVGLVSLAQLFPLIAGSLLGGSAVDAIDRRRLLIVAQVLLAGCSAGLAINADLGPALWPLFVLPALAAGFGALDDAGRSAIVPNLVQRSEVSTANAIFQALFQFGLVAGPAVAGLLLAGAGVRFVYWMDVASFGAAATAAFLISPQPPAGAAGHRLGLRSIIEGLGFVRGRQVIQGAYLIDINAMVFGMPRALFPALATTLFGGGAATLGFLYAAPGAGALVGALTTGWVGRVRAARPGRHRGRRHLGCRHHLLRAGVLAARRAGAAGGGRLGRRDLGGVPQYDHPAGGAGRAARPSVRIADRGGYRRSAHRGPGVRRGRGRLRRHRVGGVRGPGVHRRGVGPGPRAARLPSTADAGALRAISNSGHGPNRPGSE